MDGGPFAEKGYHGASLDDVAEAAGFTKGAVYSNFARKSDLFRALLERESRRRNAALGTAIEAVPFKLLPELGEWLERQSGEHRDWDVLTVEFWLAAVRDPEMRITICEGRDEALKGFSTIVQRKLEAAGAHPVLSGRDLAILLDALGTGLLMSQHLDQEADHGQLFARAVRKLVANVEVEEPTAGSRTPGS